MAASKSRFCSQSAARYAVLYSHPRILRGRGKPEAFQRSSVKLSGIVLTALVSLGSTGHWGRLKNNKNGGLIQIARALQFHPGILRNPNVAMTVWWDHVGYQVRVVGVAEPIEEAEATLLLEDEESERSADNDRIRAKSVTDIGGRSRCEDQGGSSTV